IMGAVEGHAASVTVSCRERPSVLASRRYPVEPLMRYRPAVVAFDVVETLFSLETLGDRLKQAGLPAHALETWFARFLRDAFAVDAAGVYRGFRDVASGTLEVLLEDHRLERSAVDPILKGLSELKPHPDVRPGMEALRDAGIRMVALTNGGAENTRILFSKANLDGMIERVISIDEVRRWKPAREVYQHAAKVAGNPPEDLAMVATHPWDTQGAGRAGLTTGWLMRGAKTFPPFMDPPDVKGATLADVARELLRLPVRGR
ncbi:MAG: haloacid dehalogenase type II, partial [Acidobacteria bacterium]|nr:haloacid dehalogenase type II [Acidobacteriota bacterium]